MTEGLWRITLPIEKSEARADGHYLIGIASGITPDLQNDEMTEEAIKSFAQQINDRMAAGDPIPYRDNHAKDGVLRDLGWVTKGWVTPDFELGVEVKLDDANPAAPYLWTLIHDQGKQFGMSVRGKALASAARIVEKGGRLVRQLGQVLLEEISNTTKPVWTPSFGTVISKALDEAEAAEDATEGDPIPMDKEVQKGADETPEVIEEKPVDEAAAAEETEKAETEEAEKAEPEAELAEDEVEKAGARISKVTAETLRGLYVQMQNTFRALGIEELGEIVAGAAPETETPTTKSMTAESSAEAETTPDENAVEKSEEDPKDARIVELEKSLTDMTARIAELETRSASAAPRLVTESEDAVDVEKALTSFKSLDPHQRLALGLGAMYKR